MPPGKLHISRIGPVTELNPLDQDEAPETTSLLRNRRDPSHMDAKTNGRSHQTVLLQATQSTDDSVNEDSMEVRLAPLSLFLSLTLSLCET